MQAEPTAPVPSRWLKRRGRKGIAILLTLGILSLLLIMAMGFLFNSSTGRSVSIVNADGVRAKMLADSALQRFIAMVERDFSTVSDMNPGVGFYAPTGNDWAGRRYVATVLTGGDAVEGSDSPLYAKLGTVDFTPVSLSTDASLNANVQWVNVVSYKDTSATPGAGTDSVARVIGRYAILGIDETGKIDPSAAVPTATETAGGDTGVEFGEVFINNAFTTALAAPGQFYSNLGTAPKWDSWYHLLKGGVTGLTIANGGSAIFPHSREIEAFADFTDTSIAKHRFDLKNWDGGAISDITTAASNFDSASTGGIQWLSGGDSYAAHVAANLRDYIDSDDALTTVGTAPGYTATGNEEVPCINELIVQVRKPTSYGANNAELGVTAEVLNLYKTAGPRAAGQIVVEVGYAWGGSTGTENLTIDVSAAAVGAVGSGTASYLTGTDTGTFTLASADSAAAFTVTSIRASFQSAAAVLWDFAYGPANATGVTMGAGVRRECSVEVNDPRLNHLQSQWTWEGSWGATATAGTPDGTNSTIDMTGGDLEATPGASDTQLVVSTAFIRNAGMECLWELGAIPRGEPWQTVNLNAFNGASATIGSYSAGDADILDHVKLTNEEVVSGKLNANSKYELAWRALLGHVKLGASYNDLSGGSVAISTTGWSPGDGWYDLVRENGASATDPSDGIMHLTNTQYDQNGKWQNRGQIATVPNFTSGDPVSGTAYSTDAAKEELIGKLAHHLTTRSNWYSVVICSQAIQPELYAATLAATGTGTVKVLAETKLLAVVYRDAYTGDVRVEHVQPLED